MSMNQILARVVPSPAAVVALLLTAALLPAQISRIEHRKYSWQEQRRRVLLEHCKTAEPAVLMAVAKALGQVQESVPPLTMARALAVARGVKADPAFLFRAGLDLYAMPEVLARPRFAEIPVVVHAPYRALTGKQPMPKSWGFVVRIRDARGKLMFEGPIEEHTDMDALREFRCMRKVPCADWPAGRYGIEVEVLVDGHKPRAHDLPLRSSITIADDFSKRAEALRSEAFAKELAALELRPRLMLLAAADHGRRAWHGTPGLHPDTAMVDLARAERMRANAKAGRRLVEGLGGWLHTGLPGDPGGGDAPGPGGAAEDLVFVSLRLPEAGLPKPDSKAYRALQQKPLLLFFASHPQLNLRGDRPSAPRSTLPRFLSTQLELCGFDGRREFQVCVVESPGRWRGLHKSVAGMLSHLAEVFPYDPQKLMLIGDGHGAAAAAAAAEVLAGKVRALVLANNPGGVATPLLRRLAPATVLALPGMDYYAAKNLDALGLFAKQAGKGIRFKLGAPQTRPWCLVLPLASRELEALARQVFE